MLHKEIPHPEEPEHERDDRADDQRGHADDEADEYARDAEREADRPEARGREMLCLALVVGHSVAPCVPCSGW
jgi:hypothetical protein